MKRYYSLDRIKSYNAPYNIIIGERSNGKTYAVKKEIINNFLETGGKFMYIRRRQEQKSRKLMYKLFSDISDYAIDVLHSPIYYNVEQGFYIDTEEGSKIVGYCTSIEECATYKGIPFNDVNLIFFDEFLEYGRPIEDEISKFLNVISTIVRKRSDVTVYLVGNTITKFSPYFDLFGIDIAKIKIGSIYYFKHESGVVGVIERCESMNIIDGKKESNKYLGFDNNAISSMILYGEWEYDVVNTKSVDGIGWSVRRRLIPIYYTALGECYELSIYEGKNPVAFIRKPNTQKGCVNAYIKYNLSYDNSLTLTNTKGIVPTYKKINSLVDEDTRGLYKLFCECIEAGRVVFDTVATGSDFTRTVKRI